MIDTIAAFIVSFNPESEIVGLVRSIISSGWKIAIIDNGSTNETSVNILLECESAGAEVFRLGENIGIASALNHGLNHAVSRKYKWSISFDQDSSIDRDFAANCAKILQNIDYATYGILAPVVYEEGSNKIYQGQNIPKNGDRDVDFVITSGMIINVNTFCASGGFDDRLFIDYVDYDFCMKIRSMGKKIKIFENLHIYHKVGRPTKNNFFGYSVITTNHNATRRYFKHRNFYLILRSEYQLPKAWIARQFLALCIEPIKILLYEDNKLNKLVMITKGVKDGLFGVYSKSNIRRIGE